jgi:hypothetical protein
MRARGITPDRLVEMAASMRERENARNSGNGTLNGGGNLS